MANLQAFSQASAANGTTANPNVRKIVTYMPSTMHLRHVDERRRRADGNLGKNPETFIANLFCQGKNYIIVNTTNMIHL